MIEGDWARVKALFIAALELPEDRRESFFNAQPESPKALTEARSLLQYYLDSPDFLDGATARWPEGLFRAFSGQRDDGPERRRSGEKKSDGF